MAVRLFLIFYYYRLHHNKQPGAYANIFFIFLEVYLENKFLEVRLLGLRVNVYF